MSVKAKKKKIQNSTLSQTLKIKKKLKSKIIKDKGQISKLRQLNYKNITVNQKRIKTAIEEKGNLAST